MEFFRTIPHVPATNDAVSGEERWIALARHGDREAFGRLVLLHRERLRGLLFRLAGPDGLDDLEQDVFIKAWRGIRRFRGDAAFSTWITRIAIRTSHGALRRRRPAAGPLPEMPARGPGPVDRAAARERLDRVRAAVETLPAKLRIVFALRYVEDLGGPEIAAALGIREATVRSRLTAARQALAGRLAE